MASSVYDDNSCDSNNSINNKTVDINSWTMKPNRRKGDMNFINKLFNRQVCFTFNLHLNILLCFSPKKSVIVTK